LVGGADGMEGEGRSFVPGAGARDGHGRKCGRAGAHLRFCAKFDSQTICTRKSCM